MAQPTDLEARIAVLEDVEGIKQLKAKYWRCAAGKLWEELAECFSEDAVADFGPNKSMKGKAAILAQLRGAGSHVGKESVIGSFHGHNPEIKITGQNTAVGIWQFQRYTVDNETGKRQFLGAFYNDEYVKENGQWLIASYQTNIIFKEDWERLIG